MKYFLQFILCLSALTVQAVETEVKQDKMTWWREARFGMFIHWGIYSIPGGEYKGYNQKKGGAEWIMNRMKIPVAEYQVYAKEFNPVKFDAEAWVKTAKDAGMKYIVITAKHHDGFAMFKSSASSWNIVDATPYKKDVLQALAQACRKYDVKLGFYYSQAQDWNNPGGSAAREPMAVGWPNPEAQKIDAYTKDNKGHWDSARTTASFDEYINRVSIPQVKELLSNYGDVAVFFWDTPLGMTPDIAQKFLEVVKPYPSLISNDRLYKRMYGDYRTPEQRIPTLDEIDGADWETCMTMNNSWGFRKNENIWKTPETLIQNLVDIASKGGNFLLNVGPKSDGEFPVESVEGLKAMGAWMKVNGESVYGTLSSPIRQPEWGRSTRKDTTKNTIVYLTVFNWPKDGKLIVSGLNLPVRSASLLADGRGLTSSKQGDVLNIDVPTDAPDKIASVIKIELDGKLPPNVYNAKIKPITDFVDYVDH
jgi:alpha-L-fucosidase